AVAITSGADTSPRVSPDGSQILFDRGTSGVGSFGYPTLTTTDLYRAPVLGGSARRVASAAGDADWSPDGTSIAFVRVEGNAQKPASALFLVSPDGGALKEIARFPDFVLVQPRFSPDGK